MHVEHWKYWIFVLIKINFSEVVEYQNVTQSLFYLFFKEFQHFLLVLK